MWLLALLLCAADAVPAQPQSSSWTHEAGATFALTSGNSRSTTVGLSGTSVFKNSRWRLLGHADFLEAKAGSELAAHQRNARLETERTIRAGLGAVVRLSHFQDRFADFHGLNTAELGGGWRISDRPDSKAELNATLAWTGEERYVGRSRTYVATRWVLTGARRLNGAVSGEAVTDLLADLSRSDNWRSTSSVSVTAALSRLLKLKTSAKFTYAHLPAAGKKSTDSAVTAALILQWPPSKD